MGNYSPISILSKVLGKNISNHLKLYLQENNLLSRHQSGFRKFHTCEKAQNNIIDNWNKAINNNNIVGTIFSDLTKAFDLLNDDLLLNKH